MNTDGIADKIAWKVENYQECLTWIGKFNSPS